jgi:hypothetical protein
MLVRGPTSRYGFCWVVRHCLRHGGHIGGRAGDIVLTEFAHRCMRRPLDSGVG